jgi:hypothetical protein
LDTSFNTGEDEKELVLENTFLTTQFPFLFSVTNRLTTAVAAAIIAEHAKTNLTSSDN